MTIKFYRCDVCGNIITKLKDSGVIPVCCNAPVRELVAGSVDASAEKHVPDVKVNSTCVNVTIGEVPHPMIDTHYIEWIALESVQGVQIKYLNADFEQASALFELSDGDTAICVYAYCNLHGLWKKDLI
ncbi:MAG: desulfoferrodoxin family protein [Succinivibrio sp.]